MKTDQGFTSSYARPGSLRRLGLFGVLGVLLTSAGCSSSGAGAVQSTPSVVQALPGVNVSAIAVSPDGGVLVGTSGDGLYAGNLVDGAITLGEHYTSGTQVAIAGDTVRALATGRTEILVGSDGGATLMSRDNGKITGAKSYTSASHRSLMSVSNITEVAIDGNVGVMGSYGAGVGAVSIGQLDGTDVSRVTKYTLKDVLPSDPKSEPSVAGWTPTAVAFDRSGRYVMIGSSTSGVEVAELNREAVKFTSIKSTRPQEAPFAVVNDIEASPVDDLVLIGANEGLAVARLVDGTLSLLKTYGPKNLPMENTEVWDIARSPNGAQVAVANPDGGAILADIDASGTLSKPVLYSTAGGAAISSDSVSSVAFSPDGKYLLIGTASGLNVVGLS